ncbi:MAG: tRNA (adenosine(37)-N6)-threonylcarbamoyltransferase complex transferase subunit TsaD [Fibrobacteres bacterium]|nr:tRNA (adenosine(37)-N6)-threonylcarbamoyltransferase complex transferase subunit TsaD [Fibrobacterota bacterium]
MIILGIESSCDETSAGVIKDDLTVLSNRIYSQKDHEKFGGVVPEIAAREHIKKIDTVVASALEETGVKAEEIGLVAATNSPGLIGALLVGLSFAKGFAYKYNVPFVTVNHMDAHVRANHLAFPELEPPYTVLVVSGGHTFILNCDHNNRYELLGNTLDDAAGEAIDKGGKVLGIGYPAGRELERLSKLGNASAFNFPRALPEKVNLNFSFSGLKTALKNQLKKMAPQEITEKLNDIAASYQEAIMDQLSIKALNAMKMTGSNKLLLAGGVACNGRLREKIQNGMKGENKLYFPPLSLCTDNGAMIAAAGLLKYKRLGADPLTAGASAVFNLTEVNYGS